MPQPPSFPATSLTVEGSAPRRVSSARTACSCSRVSARCSRKILASSASRAMRGACSIWTSACSSIECASVRYLVIWSSRLEADMPPGYPRRARCSLQRRMTDVRYDPSEIEPRWQKVWADEGTWHVSNGEASDREKSYVLVMLPYPSGEAHIGHLKVYSVGDAVAHFHRRNGRRVLNPMGYDAFGLPAENHAIKTGQHPRASTDEAIASFRRTFHELGVSIDWSREFGTHEPRYYRWTQWIFLQLYERGLAYRKDAAVKWCPNDQTVLANEQVIDGRCERCGHEVEVKQLEQWFFRITDYAD